MPRTVFFKNIWLKTIRDNYRSILIWGISAALLLLATIASYDSVFPMGALRDQLVKEYYKASQSFVFVTGPVIDVDTIGGFATTRFLNQAPLILGLLAVLLGSALIRGEEERGSLDVLLSTPVTRLSALLQKWAGMATVLTLISMMWGLGLVAGRLTVANSGISLANIGLAVINLVVTVLVWGSLALLMGNFMARRNAAIWAGGIMAATYFLKNLAIQVPALDGLKYISPFYLYDQSRPLARSIGTNPVSIFALLCLSLIFLALAVFTYLRRDHGRYYELTKNTAPVVASGNQPINRPNAPGLSGVFSFAFIRIIPGSLVWAAAISSYTVLVVSSANTSRELLQNLVATSSLLQNFGFGVAITNETVIAFSLLVVAVLTSAYAVTQVANWSSEENEGHLELVLSTPQARPRLLLVRFLATLAASAVFVLIQFLVFELATIVFNTPVALGNALGAFAGLWVVSAVIAGAGYLLTALQPTMGVAILSSILVLSFFADLLGSIFKLPEWVVNLSIFRQYGRPLADGLNWTTQGILIAIVVVMVSLAMWRFGQRDIIK